MKIMNKKGFTLVELLAVIVVLAIIMIIAVPSVMDSMNSARKNAFKIYAQKVLNTAQTKYQADILTGGEIKNCYSLQTLMGSSVGNYKGFVQITGANTDTVSFTITLRDNNYYIGGQDYSSLEGNINNRGTNKITYPTGCEKKSTETND